MKISFSEYNNKVLGGWIGKCFGGAAGAAVEGFKEILDFPFEKTFNPDIPNDDLDIQLLWLDIIAKKGDKLTSRDLADGWNTNCWYPFNEYGKFLKNYELGIYPPLSGEFDNRFFCESEGSPIRSEVWAMVFPGQPVKAAEFAQKDSCLDHAGSSTYIEMYYASLESRAFFESSILELLKKSSNLLPKGSRTRECYDFVMNFYKNKKGLSWKECREALMKNFASNDFTNAVINFGIVLIALLYGNMDMHDTVDIAFRSGFDTDCTCATSASILGIIHGKDGLDNKIITSVSDKFICGIIINDDNRSLKELAFKTCCFGCQMGKNKIDISEIPDIPQKYIIPEIREEKIKIFVEYNDIPAIAFNDEKEFTVKICNNSRKEIIDSIHFSSIPKGWSIDWNDKKVSIKSGENLSLKNKITTNDVNFLNEKNILYCTYNKGKADFGFRGAVRYHAAGPYFEALKKEDPPELPKAHSEGCILPNVECMINNFVGINREYIQEQNISRSIISNQSFEMNGFEDLIPIEKNVRANGQYCIYLTQKFELKEDKDLWLVLGNTDGFKLWVNSKLVMTRDECRLWTPYNNYLIVHFTKGANTISLKLLRRTEILKFSIALRNYDGEHFHRKRYFNELIHE